jgi:hypothetical protein
VKAAGLGLLFANGKAILNTRMYTNLSEILAGWTRILSASMNYEVTTVLRFLVVQLLISFPMFLLALCAYVPLSRELWPSAWVALPLL